jgi:hypothetical protein
MSDSFYVGYLDPAPDTVRRMRRIAFGLIVLAGVAATALAIATGPFDRSTYDYGTVREWQGRLELSPIPVVMATTFPVAGSPFGVVQRFPLVAPGKHGADRLVADFGGAWVRLKATRIVRGGTTMLEVVPGSIVRFEPPVPENGRPAPAATIEDLGDVAYSGEIVDSKCFLGVMNPGRLEVHRACAIRCIAGGIPPMLFARESDGREAHLLLVDANGRPLNDRVLGDVARPVTMRGRLERRDDVYYLYVDSWRLTSAR